MYSAIEADVLHQSRLSQKRRRVKAVTLYMRFFFYTTLILISLRFTVLVSESYAMISTARSSNGDLLNLCNDGVAANSPHMRTACVQARVEQASPIILRAVNSAAFAFCTELYNIALAPLQALSIASILGILSAIPWMTTLRFALGYKSAVDGFMNTDMLNANRIGVAYNGTMAPDHSVYIMRHGDREEIAPKTAPHRRLLSRPTIEEEEF